MHPVGSRALTGPSHWPPLPGLDGLWHAAAVRSGVPLRAVALRTAEHKLAVYSPVRGLGDEAHRELSALGTPECLVAPNHYHHLGLAEYAAAYPGAAIVASATALPRLRKKHALAIADESRLRGALPPHISLHVPPGTRAGELWLSVAGASGRAWVVCDAFFNVAHAPRTPMGLLLRALGIAPGLRIGTSFLWLLRDRAAYCDWLLSKLAEERPTLLVPSHGDVVQDDSLPERLRALVERRLR